jgi:hypothetical protein
MIAYLLVLVAVLTRVIPHAGWYNFTAVGGSLLYFGARRPLRELAAPVAALMATDFYLTAFVYQYPFHWPAYVITWAWYAAAIVLGWILLRAKTSWVRVGAAALLGPTSFFMVSNFSVWAGSNMYPHTPGGLIACYVAAIPFYRNDLISTTLVLAAAFGIPVLVRRMHPVTVQHQAS